MTCNSRQAKRSIPSFHPLFWLIACAAALLAISPVHAAKDEVTATGQLERIMDRSITIRRADGVLIDARLLHTGKLRADVLVTKFHLGDNVDITCKAVAPAWDEDAHLFRVLELERIELLKKPSANDYYISTSSRAWREPGNMLKPPRPEFIPKPEGSDRAVEGPPEEKQAFEHAREVNLKLLAALPSYSADETATRATSETAPPHWRQLDVILADITFKGPMETRDQVFQNNRLVQGGMKEVRGLRWSGDFSARLRPLFDAECPVTFRFVQKNAVNGRDLLIYDFRAPADSCFPPTVYSYLRFYAAQTGRVWIDAATGRVVQLEQKATEFPKGFVFVENDRSAAWDNVTIGGTAYWLPVSADEIVRYTSGQFELINLKYSKFRPVQE